MATVYDVIAKYATVQGTDDELAGKLIAELKAIGYDDVTASSIAQGLPSFRVTLANKGSGGRSLPQFINYMFFGEDAEPNVNPTTGVGVGGARPAPPGATGQSPEIIASTIASVKPKEPVTETGDNLTLEDIQEMIRGGDIRDASEVSTALQKNGLTADAATLWATYNPNKGALAEGDGDGDLSGGDLSAEYPDPWKFKNAFNLPTNARSPYQAFQQGLYKPSKLGFDVQRAFALGADAAPITDYSAYLPGNPLAGSRKNLGGAFSQLAGMGEEDQEAVLAGLSGEGYEDPEMDLLEAALIAKYGRGVGSGFAKSAAGLGEDWLRADPTRTNKQRYGYYRDKFRL